MEPVQVFKFGLFAVVDENRIKWTTYCIQLILSAIYIKLQELVAIDSSSDISPYDWLHHISAESVSFGKWL